MGITTEQTEVKYFPDFKITVTERSNHDNDPVPGDFWTVPIYGPHGKYKMIYQKITPVPNYRWGTKYVYKTKRRLKSICVRLLFTRSPVFVSVRMKKHLMKSFWA